MNTTRTARSTARTVFALLRALLAETAMTLLCQCAVAGDMGAETAPAVPTPAAQLIALNLRESVARHAGAQRAQPRLGMHVVVRLAVVDVVSHPDSGDVDLTLRSRLLNRSIARKPLAVGVAWRF